MTSTLRATLLSLLRTPSALIWTLAFPILMATIFMFMFSGISNGGTWDAVPVAAVEDAAWEVSPFSQVVDALANDEDALLAVTPVDDADEAHELLVSGAVDGVFSVGGDGAVELSVAPESSTAHQGSRGRAYSVNRSILELVASSYTQSEALIAQLAQDDPAALADPARVEAALGLEVRAERVSLTRSLPDESVRYYYALLGMVVMFSAQLAFVAVAGICPAASPVAARRSVAAMSRMRQLAGAALGAWLLSFAFLTIAFGYIRLVVGIDFAGREALCIAGLAAGALLATGLGSLVGTLPLRGFMEAGAGILSGVTCVLSIFAGLYGEPSMQLADAVARAVPLSAWINPTKLVCDLFHSLYFYESLMPFGARLVACAVWGVALFGAAVVMVRRNRYASL